MKKIKLYNGFELPCMGYGTFPSKEELLDNILNAYSEGYRLIDTSDDYNNEKFIGIVRKDNPYMNDMFVSTKISDVTQLWNFDKNIQNQKNRLNIPEDKSFDLLLLHFPYPYLYIDAWKEMEKLYSEGKCKAIGVCNFEIPHLKELLKKCKIKPMVNQIELHPLFQRKELCEYCNENGIAVMSYSPVARMDKRLIENDVLKQIADNHNKSVVQVILRWNIQHEYIPLPATANKNHIKSNIDIFDFDLSSSDMSKIDELDSGLRVRFDTATMWSKTKRLKLLFRHLQYKFHLYN